MEKMNLNNKNESVTRKMVKELLKELLKELRTARRHIKCASAVIMEELTHEFKRLWIYKRLHIRIG